MIKTWQNKNQPEYNIIKDVRNLFRLKKYEIIKNTRIKMIKQPKNNIIKYVTNLFKLKKKTNQLKTE